MLRTGVVQEVQGEQLTIIFERPEACEKCGQCDGGRHAHKIQLAGTAKPGDRVTVEMPESRVVGASLLAYVVPLCLLLLGLLVADPLYARFTPPMPADIFALLCAAFGLLVSFAYLRIVDRRVRGKKRWTPQIVTIEPAAGQTTGER